jgi:hypothetical protein
MAVVWNGWKVLRRNRTPRGIARLFIELHHGYSFLKQRFISPGHVNKIRNVLHPSDRWMGKAEKYCVIARG